MSSKQGHAFRGRRAWIHVPAVAGVLWAVWGGRPSSVRAEAASATSSTDRNRPVGVKARFIIDNDGTNLFVRSVLTDDDLRWAVAQCPTSVTTYMVCPNWCSTFTYPCKVGEVVPRALAPALVTAIERGQDPFGNFLTYLRQAGKEVFITYRMNDVHNANDPNDPGTASFKKQHPEWLVDPSAPQRKDGDWMNYGFDYSHAEVRAYILRSLTDLAERYDVDGFQLDWMRFPRHLSGTTAGQAWSKRDALTGFVASVRKMLDEVGSRRGRRMLLAVRVPTTPAGCKYLGVDVAEWARQKLIDFLTPAPFLSCDYVIPFEAFRNLLADHPIPLYAGTDLNHSGRCHTVESYRGWALSMYDQGADGLNLFNFPCWTEYIGEQPYEWIADLNDPNKLTHKPALYTLVAGYHRIGGVDQPTPLPVTIHPAKGVDLVMKLPRIALPASRALLLTAASGEVQVSVNGTRLSHSWRAPSGNLFMPFMDAELLNREPPAAECRVFMVPPALLRGGDNILTITSSGKSASDLRRVDLGVWY